MARPKRTEKQRYLDLEKEAALYAKGWTQHEIGESMGLTKQSISRDLKEVWLQVLNNCQESIQQVKARQMANLMQIIKEGWREYERSKAPLQITTNTVEQSNDTISVGKGDDKQKLPV